SVGFVTLNFPEEAHDVPMRSGEDIRTTNSGLWLVPFTLIFGRVDSLSCLLKGFLGIRPPRHEGHSRLFTWLEDEAELVVVAPAAQVNSVVLTTGDAQAYLFLIVFDRCIHIGRVDLNVRNMR